MPPIYDDVPQDAAFPYVTLGDDTHLAFDTDDSLGAESTIVVHVWSRYRGRKEVKEIQSLIYERLVRQFIPVQDHDLITIEFEYSDVIMDPDGMTRHGVQRFRVLTERYPQS